MRYISDETKLRFAIYVAAFTLTTLFLLHLRNYILFIGG